MLITLKQLKGRESNVPAIPSITDRRLIAECRGDSMIYMKAHGERKMGGNNKVTSPSASRVSVVSKTYNIV